MGKKKRKREVDKQLLDSLFAIEYEWKQIQSILDKSIESTEDGFYKANLARAKYLYLLKEAKHRKIRATRFHQ